MRFRQILLLLLFVCFQPPVFATSVWDVITNQFFLNHELNQIDVQSQLKWLINHPNYLQQLTRSKPYIYHIVSEIKKRGLPGELALLPMLESAYDPFAYSEMGAAGLWQIMPSTGTSYGLRQDWWSDGRRNIASSTNAALNYLTYLHKFFSGDWLEAIAAYDAGEGGVSRAIRLSGQQLGKANFWTLPLPSETKAYVPRLLALAEIIKNPAQYNIKLPFIPYEPYFEEIDIGSQIDLSNAANLAGISYKEFISLNPGFNHWATAPYKPYKLLIPVGRIADFTQNLEHTPKDKRVSFIKHQVRSGETLASIANLYFTTVKIIRELNLLDSDYLELRQSLLVPSSNYTQKLRRPLPIIEKNYSQLNYYKIIHIVQANEEVETLETKYQISKEQIYLWNRLDPYVPISKGQALIIWRTKL